MDTPTERLLFTWVDYALFSLMLLTSALIGVYFGFFGKKQDNTAEYLLGGKTMSIFPVAMSLIASHLSGISMLGIPAEIYNYGMYYSMCFLTDAISILLVMTVYLPVFYKLQLTCSFEYLNLRFDYRCQMMASFIYTVSMMLYIPLVIYIPALAFSQVTGLSIHFITPITCVICIFYTTVGGLKAVVWTDTLQLAIMIGAMIAVLCMGLSSAGGFFTVWEVMGKGNRLEFFNMDLDPTVRTSFWGIVVGMTMSQVSYIGVTQSSVQRFLAVPTKSAAQKVVVGLGFGLTFIKFFICGFGMLLYAHYADCDPLRTDKIKRSDQILPYYVMEIAGTIPGLPGLFIAGVFCAALSSMSSVLNTLAGTIYEDFISRFMPSKTTEKRASDIMKIIVVLLGIFSTAMIFLVDKMGGVMQLSYSLSGITIGPMLGIFTLGMLFPSANKKGALIGSVVSMAFMSVMVIGYQYYVTHGYGDITKPMSTEGCDLVNSTIKIFEPINQASQNAESMPSLFFRISFYYYTLLGAVVLIVVGLLVSWATGKDKDVHKDLLSPVVHWTLPLQQNYNSDYQTVKEALRGVACADKDAIGNYGEKEIEASRIKMGNF